MMNIYEESTLNFWIWIDIKYTIKPAHAVTSIKQSPVLKGHIFLFGSGHVHGAQSRQLHADWLCEVSLQDVILASIGLYVMLVLGSTQLLSVMV